MQSHYRVLVIGGAAVAGRLLHPAEPAPSTPPAVPAALADQPNLLLIVVDTLRADALSCYGGSVEATHICGLAEQEGTLFTGFSHASWTKPSFASLLTSTLPSTHNTMSKTSTLPPDLVMVSEALQQHGYATGGIVANIGELFATYWLRIQGVGDDSRPPAGQPLHCPVQHKQQCNARPEPP